MVNFLFFFALAPLPSYHLGARGYTCIVTELQSAITNAISPFLRQQQAAIEAVASGMTETKRKIRKQAPASERHSEKLKKQRTELGVVKRKLVDKERQDKNFDRAYQENWDAVQMEFTQIQTHNKELEEPACLTHC